MAITNNPWAAKVIIRNKPETPQEKRERELKEAADLSFEQNRPAVPSVNLVDTSRKKESAGLSLSPLITKTKLQLKKKRTAKKESRKEVDSPFYKGTREIELQPWIVVAVPSKDKNSIGGRGWVTIAGDPFNEGQTSPISHDRNKMYNNRDKGRLHSQSVPWGYTFTLDEWKDLMKQKGAMTVPDIGGTYLREMLYHPEEGVYGVHVYGYELNGEERPIYGILDISKSNIGPAPVTRRFKNFSVLSEDQQNEEINKQRRKLAAREINEFNYYVKKARRAPIDSDTGLPYVTGEDGDIIKALPWIPTIPRGFPGSRLDNADKYKSLWDRGTKALGEAALRSLPGVGQQFLATPREGGKINEPFYTKPGESRRPVHWTESKRPFPATSRMAISMGAGSDLAGSTIEPQGTTEGEFKPFKTPTNEFGKPLGNFSDSSIFKDAENFISGGWDSITGVIGLAGAAYSATLGDQAWLDEYVQSVKEYEIPDSPWHRNVATIPTGKALLFTGGKLFNNLALLGEEWDRRGNSERYISRRQEEMARELTARFLGGSFAQTSLASSARFIGRVQPFKSGRSSGPYGKGSGKREWMKISDQLKRAREWHTKSNLFEKTIYGTSRDAWVQKAIVAEVFDLYHGGKSQKSVTGEKEQGEWRPGHDDFSENWTWGSPASNSAAHKYMMEIVDSITKSYGGELKIDSDGRLNTKSLTEPTLRKIIADLTTVKQSGGMFEFLKQPLEKVLQSKWESTIKLIDPEGVIDLSNSDSLRALNFLPVPEDPNVLSDKPGLSNANRLFFRNSDSLIGNSPGPEGMKPGSEIAKAIESVNKNRVPAEELDPREQLRLIAKYYRSRLALGVPSRMKNGEGSKTLLPAELSGVGYRAMSEKEAIALALRLGINVDPADEVRGTALEAAKRSGRIYDWGHDRSGKPRTMTNKEAQNEISRIYKNPRSEFYLTRPHHVLQEDSFKSPDKAEAYQNDMQRIQHLLEIMGKTIKDPGKEATWRAERARWGIVKELRDKVATNLLAADRAEATKSFGQGMEAFSSLRGRAGGGGMTMYLSGPGILDAASKLMGINQGDPKGTVLAKSLLDWFHRLSMTPERRPGYVGRIKGVPQFMRSLGPTSPNIGVTGGAIAIMKRIQEEEIRKRFEMMGQEDSRLRPKNGFNR